MSKAYMLAKDYHPGMPFPKSATGPLLQSDGTGLRSLMVTELNGCMMIKNFTCVQVSCFVARLV